MLLVWISRGPSQQLCDSFNSNRYSLIRCKPALNIPSFKRTALIPFPDVTVHLLYRGTTGQRTHKFSEIRSSRSPRFTGNAVPWASYTGIWFYFSERDDDVSARSPLLTAPFLSLKATGIKRRETLSSASCRALAGTRPGAAALRRCFPHRAAEERGGESPRCATLLEASLGSRRPGPPARPTRPDAAATHLHGIGEVELLRGASELLPGLVVRHGGPARRLAARRYAPFRSSRRRQDGAVGGR